MNFGSKWSELSAEDKQKAKDQYGSKQSWQDAKARSQGYANEQERRGNSCLLYISPSPRDRTRSRMPSSA